MLGIEASRANKAGIFLSMILAVRGSSAWVGKPTPRGVRGDAENAPRVEQGSARPKQRPAPTALI